jgi:hypothetical protein
MENHNWREYVSEEQYEAISAELHSYWRDGRVYERRRQHRYAWFKLFCLIIVGTFCGLLLFNLVGMFA